MPTVARLVRASFGTGIHAVACSELPGGGFATVLRVDLSDGRTVVLKIAPPPDVPLLRYERGVIGAEARYLTLVHRELDGIAVPRLVAYGRGPKIFDAEWIFTSHLPGAALTAPPGTLPQEQTDRVRADLGALLARVHTVTGRRFGYDGDRPHGDTWREAFLAMVVSLLADAREWGVDLGIPAGEIESLLVRHGGVLDPVKRPALVHFDLWDGNLLCDWDAGGNLRLTGLVDGERYLFGDPLMDFVSPALYRHIEDEPDHPFVRGYRRVEGRATALDTAAARRLTLYRLHLYLLMTIEMPSRGITRRDRHEVLGRMVRRQLADIATW
jgi:aminoglycoside phosphotransferase (APT) family kinase protein